MDHFVCKRVICGIIFVASLLGHCAVQSIDISLNDGWTIRNANGSIALANQSLPSGVYSALHEAGLCDSVLLGQNDIALRWIAYDSWTYETRFETPFEPAATDDDEHRVLTFHGIDTAADIWLNDVRLLPAPENMFVRYRYDVAAVLRTNGTNELRVELRSPVAEAKLLADAERSSGAGPTPPNCPPDRYQGECHANQLRKMQASFAWDWGLAAPSMGLWKAVVLERYVGARIRDVAYGLRRNATHWTIDVDVHMEGGLRRAQMTTAGRLVLDIVGVLDDPERWLFEADSAEIGDDGEFVVRRSISVLNERVQLWWTNGLGNQPLYEMTVRWTSDGSSKHAVRSPALTESEKRVRIGFRTIELLEEPLADGSSFYFRVNGIAVFMKGSNWIPSHVLPELSADGRTIDGLLRSAADAHMNMLRVWGGGLYESDAFYDRADALGILIWQDMMFACAMYPVRAEFLRNVRTEIAQNVRRLRSHASIAVWAGNNENEAALVENWYGTSSNLTLYSEEYEQLYNGTIAEAVIREDGGKGRWLFSSPSNGRQRAEQKLIQDDPQDPRYGDIHYYNYIADTWNPETFPRPRFASEYGFQSYPSLSAWQSVASSTDAIPGLMNHRQHFPSGDLPIKWLIAHHLPMPSPMSEKYTEALIYMSQVAQAMSTRVETEVYRTGRSLPTVRTMGALFWQLNDVWVAPSWSAIEYGGNYKILQHWAAEFLAPFTLIAHLNRTVRAIRLTIVRDSLGPDEQVDIVVDRFEWSSLEAIRVYRSDGIKVKANTAQHFMDMPLSEFINGNITERTHFLRFRMLRSQGNRFLSDSFVFPCAPKDAIGMRSEPAISVKFASDECDRAIGQRTIDLLLTVEYPAVFVYITVQNERVRQYRLSENGFMQMEAQKHVRLTYDDGQCGNPLTEVDVRVQTVNEYMPE